MKRTELFLGQETVEVEFDETKTFKYIEEDGEEYEGAETTDGRLIVWNDGQNEWVQVTQYIEDVPSDRIHKSE